MVSNQTNLQTRTLSNGLTIVAREVRHAQSVALHGYLRAGAIQEPEGKAGVAMLTANLLGRGTHAHAAAEIQTQLDLIGARASFAAGRYLTVFKGRCLGEDLPRFFRVLTDCLLFPTFTGDELERERLRIRQWLQRMEGNARYLAETALRELFYGPDHPFSRPAGPTPTTIAQLTREDLLQFHRGTYGPGGATIVVTGNIRPEEAVHQIEDLFNAWPTGRMMEAALPLPVSSPAQTCARRAIPGCRQASLLVGAIGPGRGSRDFYAAQVGNAVLSKLGIQGRIGAGLRENGLAYDSGSRLSSGLGPEPWLIYATLHPGNVRPALELIAAEVQRLCEELVTPQEVADAKSYLIGKQQIGLADLTGLAASLAEIHLYQLGDEHLETYPTLVRQITEEDVRVAARHYLSYAVCAYVTDEDDPERPDQ